MYGAELAEKASRKIGISPEELISLPTPSRGGALEGPRRRDLFSALRLRRDATSSREKRRSRQTRERRPSVEVLAGMVARTGREARTSKPDEQQQTDNAGRELTLLRAGCQRPSIQQLHGVGEIGLGKAVALAGGDSASDFDSGISEWGSCDERESAAFEALLEEEARARRKLWNPSPSSVAPSCSSSDSSASRRHRRRRRRPRATHRSPPSFRREKAAVTTESKARPEASSKPETKESATTTDEGPSQMEHTHPAAPTLSTAAGERHRCTTAVASVREVHLCSEGTQCSGPPVNVGVQTSALRLPRKSAAGGERVVHASPPAAPPSKRTTPAEEERLEKTAAAELEVSHGGTFAGEASSEPAGGRKAGVNATTRMHVRVGLDGLEDADRGQEPTVWAMVGGSSANTASGPVILLPLEGDEKRGAAPCTAKMFLSVTEFTTEPGVTAAVAGVISADDARTAPKSRQEIAPTLLEQASGKGERGRRSRCSSHAGSEKERREQGEEEGDEEGDEEGEEEWGEEGNEEGDEEGGGEGGQWQTSRLDPLSSGVGALGERLAGVGLLFDQLEGDMDHDRQVVESYQKEAREEVGMVSRDLENIRVLRASHRSAIGFMPRVPLWRSRPGPCSTAALTNQLPAPTGTTPSSAEESPLVRDQGGLGCSFFCGSDGGDGDDYLGAEGATLKAEEELGAAREILESIERELRAGNGSTLAYTPGEQHLLAPAASAVALTPCLTEPTMRRSSRPSSPLPHALPQTRETPTRVSNVGRSPRSHPPTHTLGEDTARSRRRAVLIQKRSPGGGFSARASGGKIGKPVLGDSSANPKGLHSGKPMFGGCGSSRKQELGVPCRRGVDRVVSGKRGGDGMRSSMRSTGTAVAHFPTAVAATAKSKARDKEAARRNRAKA